MGPHGTHGRLMGPYGNHGRPMVFHENHDRGSMIPWETFGTHDVTAAWNSTQHKNSIRTKPH